LPTSAEDNVASGKHAGKLSDGVLVGIGVIGTWSSATCQRQRHDGGDVNAAATTLARNIAIAITT